MLACKRERVASEVRGEESPSYITTTLFELLAVLQDIVEPDNDPLVVAIVVQLLHSGQLTLPRGQSLRWQGAQT
jgi:hypothetical protein